MKEQEKLVKFINKLQHFVKCLDGQQALFVHRHINHAYYMQKVAELEFLHDQMKEVFEKQTANQKLICILVPEIFNQWRHDVRWLQQHSIRQEVQGGMP
jgi:hypothetical protein